MARLKVTRAVYRLVLFLISELVLIFSYNENKLLSGILCLHRITDNRVAGSSLKNLRVFQKLCGKDTLDNVYLTTTMWDEVELSVGERRLEELKTEYWKTMISLGAQVARCRSDDDSSKNLVRTIVMFLCINRSAHMNSNPNRSFPQTEHCHFSHPLSKPDKGLLRIRKRNHRDTTPPREAPPNLSHRLKIDKDHLRIRRKSRHTSKTDKNKQFDKGSLRLLKNLR